MHRTIVNEIRSLGINSQIDYYDHHLCHNLAAVHASGFKDTYALSIDAFGDFYSSRLFKKDADGLCMLKASPSYHSPAHHYSYITKVLGFRPVRHEGKISGLAAFGDATSTAALIGQRIRYDETKQRFHVAGFYKRPEVQWLAQNLKPFSREDVAAGVQAVLEETVTK